MKEALTTAPSFIQHLNPHLVPIKHEWDDSDPEFAYVTDGARLQFELHNIQDRGVLALSCGFAEWIAWRFHYHGDNTLLLNKIESVWAGIVDWHYLSDHRLPLRAEWLGPVNGPLWSAAHWLDRMVDLNKRNTFASPEAVSLSRLFMHVKARPTGFKRWQRSAIDRLLTFYPASPDNRLGYPVPRQILDDMPFNPATARENIHIFLQGLDPSRNPFLATPEKMLEAGFIGTPYTYIS